jgi:predicted FMN-binding regulatory protein PaiB
MVPDEARARKGGADLELRRCACALHSEFREDAAWIVSQVESLTARSEASFAEPWAVTDAPKEYVDKLVRAIVGIELTVNRSSGSGR